MADKVLHTGQGQPSFAQKLGNLMRCVELQAAPLNGRRALLCRECWRRTPVQLQCTPCRPSRRALLRAPRAGATPATPCPP